MESHAIIFISTLLFYSSDAGTFTWLHSDDTVNFVEGETAKLNWNVRLGAGKTWLSVKITRSIISTTGPGDVDLIRRKPSGVEIFLAERGADMDLDIQLNTNVLNVTFTLGNLSRKTDEMYYRITVIDDDPDSSVRNTKLNVDVPSSCTVQPNATTVNETDIISLSVNTTGNPPVNNYIWTHPNGSSPTGITDRWTFTASRHDTGTYKVSVYNGIGGRAYCTSNVTVQFPSSCKLHSNATTVNETEIVELNFTTTGNPPVNNYTWTHPNGSRLTWNTDRQTFPASRHDSGTYKVSVSNGVFGWSYCTRNISVQYKPYDTKISHSPNKTRFCLGSVINITCTSNANPPVDKYFLYQNETLTQENSHGRFTVLLNKPGINNFTCIPKNMIGVGEKQSLVPINVKEPPGVGDCNIISSSIINGSVIEGENVTLKCNNITGSEPLNITWSNGGHNLPNQNKATLSFDPVNRANDGYYQMTVSNGNECKEAKGENLTLSVYFPAKIAVLVCQGCQNGVAVENQTITLWCNVSGNPTPNITWMKNGVHYDNSASFPSSMNAVVFPKFSIKDTGSYTCIADNGISNADRKTIALVFNYKPENTTIKISPDKRVFCKGDLMRVRCTAEAKPAPFYSLYHNSLFLGKNANGAFDVTLVEKGNNIITCVPNNTVGVGPNKSESVMAKEPPQISGCRIIGYPSTSQPVNESVAVTLSCSGSGSPPLSGKWTKDGRVWTGNDLVFNPIHRTDAGSYTFTLNNGDECKEAAKEVPITVYYLDQLEVIGSSNKSYSQSNPLVLFNLSVNAYPSNASLSCNSSVPGILTAITSHDVGINVKQYLVFVAIKGDVDHASIVCKVENKAGVREKTLDFYRRQILFKQTFTGQFKITSQEWEDELEDTKSAAHNGLKNKCIKLFEAAYDGVVYSAAINIKEFLKGSIIARFQLEVIGQVPDPLLPLRDYIKAQGGHINGLQIDYNSIQESKDLKDNSPTPTTEDNNTLVSVLGVLLALAIVVIVILIGVIIWLRRKDWKGNFVGKRAKNNDEEGQINDISLQETSFAATENTRPNGPECEPIGRRGLATSKAGIPEYEAVTTRTQQPQSGVQSHPLPQYETADRQGQTGVVLNPPPITYQTIQPRTGDYGSLSPLTRLSPKDTVLSSTGSPTRTGEYQALQHKGVSPQYQSLGDLSKC